VVGGSWKLYYESSAKKGANTLGKPEMVSHEVVMHVEGNTGDVVDIVHKDEFLSKRGVHMVKLDFICLPSTIDLRSPKH